MPHFECVECVECSAEIVNQKAGRKRLRCPDCKSRRSLKLASVRAKGSEKKRVRIRPKVVRRLKCECGAEFEQKGPGPAKKKCETCRAPKNPRPGDWKPKGPYQKVGPQEVSCVCGQCSEPFTYIREGRGRPRRFCSIKCRDEHHRRELDTANCAHCGCSFRPARVAISQKGIQSIYCSRSCRGASQRRPEQAAENARKCSSRRRARKKGATIEDFTHLEVFERDGWKCGLCGKRVDRKLAYPHPMSASLDHIVPLCEGGDHSLRNSQCSHWICNSRKTFDAGGQMRLFG